MLTALCEIYVTDGCQAYELASGSKLMEHVKQAPPSEVLLFGNIAVGQPQWTGKCTPMHANLLFPLVRLSQIVLQRERGQKSTDCLLERRVFHPIWSFVTGSQTTRVLSAMWPHSACFPSFLTDSLGGVYRDGP
ncbi:MAG: hypothetical protein QGG09_01470, partial [Pirellulaceae bacterium]|nr:hypothetical protein [Pirellulaceae bacterium]